MAEWMWEVATWEDDLKGYVMRRLRSGVPAFVVAEEVRGRSGAAVTPAYIRSLAA